MRKPDLIIGPRDNPQTLRWHFLKAFGFQFALHKWLRSDSDRAPHDHKADNLSIILSPRGYWERIGKDGTSVWRKRYPLVPYFRKAETPHRIAIGSRPVWTIWVRWPERRRWGYWCGYTWRDADEYNASADYYRDGVSEVGRGCD
jgi:hypothetical protein